MQDLYLVVMAGGSGTRFWPRSTSKVPKQFLKFAGADQTLIGQTLSRFDGQVPNQNRYIVTTQSLAKVCNEHVGESAKILAEPAGRNTAPCVYWAAKVIEKANPDAIMMVMPADHYIPRVKDFSATIDRAVSWARTHDDLVTLGVKPTRPETGYGYLHLGAAIKDGASQVKAFVEKPNLERAEQFFKSGQYLWNGGMFVWKVKNILKAFDEFMPELKKVWEQTGGEVAQAYPQMTATSIDYGVMEKAKNVVTFGLDCGWDDLGSWTSLESLCKLLGKEDQGNVLSSGDLVAVESHGNVIDAQGKLVALLGVQDLVVVHSGDAILIAKKDRAQDIKLIVDAVKKARPDLA